MEFMLLNQGRHVPGHHRRRRGVLLGDWPHEAAEGPATKSEWPQYVVGVAVRSVRKGGNR